MKFSSLPVLLLLLSALPAVGCGSGDVVSICEDANCTAAERCVQGECRPPCVEQDDCPVGQNCAAWRFVSGETANYCVVLPYAKLGSTGHTEACSDDADCDTLRGYTCEAGRCARPGEHPEPTTPESKLFTSCADSSSCDRARGQECVEGRCRVACTDHFACSLVGVCESRAGGAYCSQGPELRGGQYYSRCVGGAQDCDAAAGFLCISSGVGDLDSYCTTDCDQDADCPGGFACGTLGASPCEDACGVPGEDVAGCVPSTEIGPGKRYHCQEPIGLVRSVCTLRGFCSPCEHDEDCRGVPGGICAPDQSGAKICTVECDPSVDSCPWGEASQCGDWDNDETYTCAHRSGACRGKGDACDPCASTADCMGKGYCTRAAFSGEQFCLDLTISCDCGADADANGTCIGHGCPTSPGGRPMLCYSGSRFAGDPLSHRCIAAGSSGNPIGPSQSGCWVR